MTYWQRLTPDQAQNAYNVELQYATGQYNRFYSGKARPDQPPYAGPFLFVGIITQNDRKTATLHITTIEEEEFELDNSKLNPLDMGGMLLLNCTMCRDFVILLREYANIMVPSVNNNIHPFKLTHEDDLHFIVDVVSKKYNNQYFYMYKSTSLGNINQEDLEFWAIIVISTSKYPKDDSIGFSIYDLDKQHLKKNIHETELLDTSKAKIIMNRNGFLRLADLLETYCDG